MPYEIVEGSIIQVRVGQWQKVAGKKLPCCTFLAQESRGSQTIVIEARQDLKNFISWILENEQPEAD